MPADRVKAPTGRRQGVSILIDADTTFIVQGITGREAVNLTRECLDYGAGAKIVGGVTPGRLGRDVHGVPVFDTVAQAVEHHGARIDGSVVTVPPAFRVGCSASGLARPRRATPDSLHSPPRCLVK